MKITIHQPEHLVWLGLVKKIYEADVFVILDSVQYSHGNVQNRNKIRTRDGWQWITVPTIKHPLNTKIKDIQISYTADWQKKYLHAIRTNYGSAKFFNNYFPEIEKIIMKNHTLLVDLNIELIMFILSSFGVSDKKIVRSSEIDLEGVTGGSNTIIAICKKMNINQYLAGAGGRGYMKLDDFEKSKIAVTFYEFHHPQYKQMYEPFLLGMSSVDLLFNYGPKAKEILFGIK